jgi:nondiscriminating aspartyl-tRNA synthetase
VFAIQAALVAGLRDHLDGIGFTAIHSPKLGSQGAEGGANLFTLPYFGREAVLAQSPQLYKEICVAAFGRVYEIGPVFRAEPHATRRHLNEYVSLDVEFGPIASFAEVMALEVGLLRAMFARVRERCAPELSLLGLALPDTERVVAIPFAEVKAWTGDSEPDLSPAEERAVCDRALDELGAELVFVTRFPSSKRPFYAMDSPDDPTVTESFDLLLRGTEITTGGQRIHDPEVLRAKLRARGMDPDAFGFFLEAHDCGLPPHGGFGLGLERLTAQLCGLDNVRDASLFPRDAHRLTP